MALFPYMLASLDDAVLDGRKGDVYKRQAASQEKRIVPAVSAINSPTLAYGFAVWYSSWVRNNGLLLAFPTSITGISLS